jgi:hypothetical protein
LSPQSLLHQTTDLLEFQELLIKVQQKHINFKELLGLILQSIVKPPISANKNSFQNNLNHRLNTSTNIPSFNRMCQEITQVEGKLTTGTLPSNPISINCAQPRPPNTNPSNQKGKHPKNPKPLSMTASANALSFQGVAPTPTQMADKGSKFNYCKRGGHWNSVCQTLVNCIPIRKTLTRSASKKLKLRPTPTKLSWWTQGRQLV